MSSISSSGESEVGEQLEVADRPDLVELVVGRRVLAEPGHRLLGERELDRGGQVGQQQRDAPAVLPGDDEELVLDAGDHERAAFGRLRAQRRQQHAEVVEHGRRQRFDAPLRAVAERRDGESPLLPSAHHLSSSTVPGLDPGTTAHGAGSRRGTGTLQSRQ